MSAADLHDLELIWPSLGPTDVIVTGTFDQWSSSIHLVKGDSGFSGIVKVPWAQKVAYKFIVDGRWRCREDRPQEEDGHGNMNNVLRTPENPQFPASHDPPARLSIPLEGAQSEGYGDIETMVTAVEFLPPAEPTIRGSLPLPIPLITVEGIAQAPSAGTPVSDFKLNTAAATEGHMSPTSETPSAKPAPFEQAPSSCDIPTLLINDHGSASLPLVNGNGEAHDSPAVSEAAMEALFAPLESAVPQFNQPPQAVQDTLALTDRVDVPPAPTPAAVLEPTTKQPQEDLDEKVHPRLITSAQASTPTTPSSSTLTPSKKRRSLFARIKRMFDKDNDKQGRKKNKP